MAKLNKDLHLSAEFLTFLKAGFFGQILFEAAMTKLECPLLPPGYLDNAHKTFDKLDRWLKDLSEELPIFATSWSAPETFDAISAMSFMRELKRDCLWLMPQIESALSTSNLSQNRDVVKLLAASIVRSAATRNSYIETLYGVFSGLGANDHAQRVAFEIDGAKEYLAIAQSIVEIFSAGSVFSVELCDKLRKEASLVPSDLRSYVHDANILINVFSKEFTFELAEIPREEAQQWIDNKIPAVAAGYWRAYGFSPQDYMEWGRLGISGAPLAANWRRANFAPEEAIKWIREGIAPVLAIQWRNASFEAPRAASMLRRGITDPSKAPDTEHDASNDDDNNEGGSDEGR